MTGKKPHELEYEEPLEEVCYLLEHFYKIKKQKGIKITFMEIKAYSELMFCDFEAWEIEAIMNIDYEFEKI